MCWKTYFLKLLISKTVVPILSFFSLLGQLPSSLAAEGVQRSPVVNHTVKCRSYSTRGQLTTLLTYPRICVFSLLPPSCTDSSPQSPLSPSAQYGGMAPRSSLGFLGFPGHGFFRHSPHNHTTRRPPSHSAPLPICPDWMPAHSCHRTYRLPFLVYLTCRMPQRFPTKLQGDSGAVRWNAGMRYQFPDIHTVCSVYSAQRRVLWSQPFQKKCEVLKLNCKRGEKWQSISFPNVSV